MGWPCRVGCAWEIPCTGMPCCRQDCYTDLLRERAAQPHSGTRRPTQRDARDGVGRLHVPRGCSAACSMRHGSPHRSYRMHQGSQPGSPSVRNMLPPKGWLASYNMASVDIVTCEATAYCIQHARTVPRATCTGHTPCATLPMRARDVSHAVWLGTRPARWTRRSACPFSQNRR